MRRRSVLPLLAVALIFGAGIGLVRLLWLPPPAQTLANGAYLAWGDCWFAVPWWRPVHCARLHTAPESGIPGGRFSLPVVYVPTWPWLRKGPPILYIAGGPGGSAWLAPEQMADWFAWLDDVAWGRDTVFYDQRGVGLSEPRLDCPELRALHRALLPQILAPEEIYRQDHLAASACHRRLLAAGYDFRHFSTRANAADAADLMRALGLDTWDLYGVSYGTRVALELLRQEPQSLHAVVLDSVYPPERHPERADAWLLDRALQLVVHACELGLACTHPPADVQAALDAVVQQLHATPLQLEVADPEGGHLQVVLGDEDLIWLLFESLYQWQHLPELPGLVLALARGETPPLLRELLASSVRSLLDPDQSDAVASAVDCRDAGPFGAAAAAVEMAAYPRVAPYLAHSWVYHRCRFWTAGDAGADFRRPVSAAVPTLLLAGQFDPVTPPQWAESAAVGLTRGTLFEFAGVGHGVLDSDACAVRLVRAFLAAPQAPQPPSCVLPR